MSEEDKTIAEIVKRLKSQQPKKLDDDQRIFPWTANYVIQKIIYRLENKKDSELDKKL